MASTPPIDYCALLQAAEAAKAKMVQGQSVVEFRDQNGESVKYGTGGYKPSDLDKYIEELRGQCNPLYAMARRPRPLGFIF